MEHCVITLQDLLDSANQKRLPTHQGMIKKVDIKWGASSRWSLRPNSVWGSIETTDSRKTHPTLLFIIFIPPLSTTLYHN